MQVRGRHFVVGWTVVFLAVAGVIVVRDHRGFALSQHVRTLDDSINAMSGRRADLEARIAELENRDVLSKKLLARGFRFASDSELIRLPAPPH